MCTSCFYFAGFLEFKDVEIQCQQDNELVVKVGMTEYCKSGEFWTSLQNACVSIMELIDWERSRPGSVYDISCSFGIDSAWNFFVEVYIFTSLCSVFTFL
jgi:DNA-directed RNA polymerase-4 subunit 1